MYDGWTNRHKTKSYIALRNFFVKQWKFCVCTLSCRPLASHTGEVLADHVRSVLKDFLPNIHKVWLKSCHDGTANMKKASGLLCVEGFQHRIAHSLHLLLTTDSLNKVPEIVSLHEKSKQIVTTLHFKGTFIEEEALTVSDRIAQDKFAIKLAQAQEIPELIKQFPLNLDKDEEIQANHANSS